MPEDFWDKYLEERRETLEREELERSRRMEKASREQKSAGSWQGYVGVRLRR